MTIVRIKIAGLSAHEYPLYQTVGSAACDIRAVSHHLIPPGEIVSVHTGMFLEIPDGYKVTIKPRSSLGRKGILIPNSPGTIDSDYRGQVQVLLLNMSKEVFEVRPGDRIAQMEVEPIYRVQWVPAEVDELTKTDRGTGGFGSTGST